MLDLTSVHLHQQRNPRPVAAQHRDLASAAPHPDHGVPDPGRREDELHADDVGRATLRLLRRHQGEEFIEVHDCTRSSLMMAISMASSSDISLSIPSTFRSLSPTLSRTGLKISL